MLLFHVRLVPSSQTMVMKKTQALFSFLFLLFFLFLFFLFLLSYGTGYICGRMIWVWIAFITNFCDLVLRMVLRRQNLRQWDFQLCTWELVMTGTRLEWGKVKEQKGESWSHNLLWGKMKKAWLLSRRQNESIVRD